MSNMLWRVGMVAMSDWVVYEMAADTEVRLLNATLNIEN
jgi:hypothetical protein